MLTESTARLVEGVTELGEQEKVHIKGVDAPVVARRLVAVTSAVRRRGRRRSTLVGRDWELATVTGMLDQSMNGKGRIVGLVGPPGIGKSRLVAEISACAAGRAVPVYTGYCESHTSDLPFHAVANLLRDINDIDRLDGDAARVSVRERLPAADPEDIVLLYDLLSIRDTDTVLPDIDPDARRRRTAALLNAAAMASTTPTVYVIEDAHWIDAVSESMIADFASVVSQTRSLLLVTYRPEYRGVLDRLPSAHRIALAALNDSESTALANELLGADASVGELIAEIAGRAAGNPLFAEEIVRDLAERGVVEGQPGAYVSRHEATDLRVPASLQAAIAARIDRLGAAAKRTLNAAAVIGSKFDADAIESLVDNVELSELIVSELIDQVAFTGRGEYAFRHPLIRAVAYESQLKSDRAQLHRQLAGALRESDSSGADAALVAEHLEAAGDLREAYDWHMRAGAWAQPRDIRAAQTSWQRAREVADRIAGDGPAEIDMRIKPRTFLSVHALRFSGSVEQTGLDELRELCASNGDDLSLAIGMGGTCTMQVFHYRFREAGELASDLVALLEGLSDPTMTISLWGIAANAKAQVGEIREAMRLAQKAIDLADRNPTMDDIFISAAAFDYTVRGICRLALGLPDWRDDVERGLLTSRPPETSHVAAMVFKTAVGMYNGGLLADATAISQTAEALEIAERSGDDFAFDCAMLSHGIVLVNAGDSYRAEGLEALAGYRDASNRHGYSKDVVRWADTEIAKEKARLGDVDGAIDMARRTFELFYAVSDILTLGPAASVLVESLLQRGSAPDIAEAEAAIERLATVPTDPGFVLFDLPLLRMRALLARARGDDAGYRDWSDKYRAMANGLGFEGHMAIAATM
jgi:adenylate cyclase